VHELSIAVSLVELASEKAAALGNVRVEALHLRLGPLAGVVKDSLLFGFEVAARHTCLEGARLEIEEVPLTAHCPQCSEERTLPGPWSLRCPECGTPTPAIVGGRELELVAMEVEEHAAPHR
jgi:hydrogenase nickel incorporation protein HypA/HybF